MPAKERDTAVDALRGAIIFLMALDHTRDFFADRAVDPMDVEHASMALFATRWITHLCAPGFVFLAGVSAAFYRRARGAAAATRFLVLRGLWLVFLELTVVHVAWFGDLGLERNWLMVLWALGGAMVALAAFVRAPRWLALSAAVAIVTLHNLFDGVHAADLGAAGWAWTLLHDGGPIALGAGRRLGVLYPLLPWVGIMLLGFTFGQWLSERRESAVRSLPWAGAGALVMFGVTRVAGVGDPERWRPRPSAAESLMAFLNVEKYPPSLCFALATLGVLAFALFLLSRHAPQGDRNPLLVFGRVPMFFYVVHLYVLHGLAWASGFALGDRLDGDVAMPQWRLLWVYVVWLVVMVALYPACSWFGRIKARRRSWWLSYL